MREGAKHGLFFSLPLQRPVHQPLQLVMPPLAVGLDVDEVVLQVGDLPGEMILPDITVLHVIDALVQLGAAA